MQCQAACVRTGLVAMVLLSSCGTAVASQEETLRQQYRAHLDGLEDQLATYRRDGDRHAEASALVYAGEAHTYFGELDEAERVLNEALEIARKINAVYTEHNALVRLGTIAGIRDRDSGVRFWEAELTRARASTDLDAIEVCLRSLSFAYGMDLQFEAEYRTDRERVRVLEALGRSGDQALVLSTLVSSPMAMIGEKLAFVQEIKLLMKRPGWEPNNNLLDGAMYGLASAYISSGERQLALQTLREVDDSAKARDDP